MFGDYLCKAQNKMGTLERVIILQQGERPAVPTAKVNNTSAKYCLDLFPCLT